jgi:cell division protein FtsW
VIASSVSRPPWRRADFVLLAAVAILVVIGLDMVYSASYVVAHNDPTYSSDSYFFVQQLIHAALGIVLLLVLQAVDYHRLRLASLPVLAVASALLVFVLVTRLSHSAYGAARWLKFGPLPTIEPSEVAKLALILYLADWLARRPGVLRRFGEGTVPFATIAAALCALVLLQPDVGTAFVLTAIAVALYFVAGGDGRHLALGLMVGTIVFVGLVFSAGYRSQRITAFLNASSDPQGVGWNITQAQIALGSGGIFGLGLGASRQKFYYLPNAHTDAIFAVLGEELGLIGTVLIVVLFGVIAVRGFRIALGAPDAFGSYLAIGITTALVVQAFLNIGVITAVIPFTGVPLPFLSYGGTSLTVTLLAVGILLNISRQTPVASTTTTGSAVRSITRSGVRA